MSLTNYRTINIDAYDPESSLNFDLASLTPNLVPVPASEVQSNVAHIRQTLRAGDGEAALRAALQSAPYGADAQGKDAHAAAVTECLTSIRASDMTPVLGRLAQSEGGSELLDVLVKYLCAHLRTASKTERVDANATQVQRHVRISDGGGRIGRCDACEADAAEHGVQPGRAAQCGRRERRAGHERAAQLA